jgi:hypothetical protein
MKTFTYIRHNHSYTVRITFKDGLLKSFINVVNIYQYEDQVTIAGQYGYFSFDPASADTLEIVPTVP